MKTYKPPKRTVLLWQIRIGIMSTMLCAVVVVIKTKFSYSFFAVDILILILFSVATGLVFWYIPTYFKNYELTQGNNLLIIKSGVFLRHERIMPEPRLIYTKRYRTPLSRVFGLSNLLFRATRAITIGAEFCDKDIDEILKEMLR